MAEIKEGAPVSRRPDETAPDGIREETQRKDHEDRDRGPVQQQPPAPAEIAFDLVEPPVTNGRQPSRPGQPARWEEKPGDRDAVESGPEKP